MENITENNRLIAEFIGYQPDRSGNYRLGDDFSSINIYSEYQDIGGYLTIEAGARLIDFTPNEMLFNSSWDWLMPVIKNIREITNTELTIHDYECFKEMKLELNPYDYSIEQVYKAVIEFIKWYNENK